MKIGPLEIRLNRGGTPRKPARTRGAAGLGGHAGARTDRLTGAWNAVDTAIDKAIRRDLPDLQKNVTGLEMDDGYVREFFREVESNVIGDQGIRFEPKCRKIDRRKGPGAEGEIDPDACEKLARAWEDFSRKRNFTVNRRFSRRRYEQMAVRAVARLGGLLTRKVRGDAFDHGLALQPIRITHLDPRFSDPDRNIHMSVEFDDWDAPVAYHVEKRRPKARRDTFGASFQKDRERIPADSCVHLFMADDFDQTQGKPWITASMRRLKLLELYEEAEVVAAIEHARTTTYFTQNDFSEFTGETTEAGDLIEKSEPGQKIILEKGIDAPHQVQATHPNANYPDFRKATLRGICAGLILNYNTLARDLEGVNYSSIRQGVLSEREGWKLIQCWFIDDFEAEIFRAWLGQAILADVLPFSIEDLPRLAHAEFEGRRWDWVDPLKDIMAAKAEIGLGVDSRTGVAGRRGRDFRTVADQNQKDEALLTEKGLAVDVSGKKANS